MVALVIGAVILAFVGGDPVRAYLHIFDAAFGDIGVLSDTLVKATPLDPDRARVRPRLPDAALEHRRRRPVPPGRLGGRRGRARSRSFPPGRPPIVVIPAMMVAGALAGGAWAFIPGILKARLGVNEIITTLMLNYIALAWLQFWVFGPWSEGGFQQTSPFPREAWLPRLTDFGAQIPVLAGLTTHLGLVFALVATAIMSVVLSRTRWGYELRLIGDNPRAARYAGIDVAKYVIVVFVISGALAGLAGMSEVSGVVHRLQDRISPGYGFTAIIIAYLARLGPWRVVLASILFGALILAGREIQPSGVPAMIQGIILFCLIASDVLLRYRVRIGRPAEAAATAPT